MPTAPLSLYVHIPFCSLKCSYCDFNSYAGLDAMAPPFVEALLAEIDLWSRIVEGRPVATVFFGGGTPTLLAARQNAQILDRICRSFRVEPGAEVTIEANPGTVNLRSLRDLVHAGFNRMSFGVQSFDDAELAALDRIHTANEAIECYTWARKAGFRRVSLDLIYGLPDQVMARWQANVEQAIALGPDHLSLYALTVEEGTKLAYYVDHGSIAGPDPDLQADMYEWSCARLANGGYIQYEISNWAQPGEECRHNLVYWRNGEWLGLGPGAHSHWNGYRFANIYSPRRYIDLLNSTPSGQKALVSALPGALTHVTLVEPQTPDLQVADTAILALRLNEGLDLHRFEQRHGARFDDVYGETVSEMAAAGLLQRINGSVRLTARGRLLANEVFARLLPD